MNKYLKLVLIVAASVYFWNCALSYTEWHFLDTVNLIFHEAGHTIFSFMGQFIRIAAGSGFQIALPILISLYFFRTGQKLAGSLIFFWVGLSILNVSVYAGDALALQLELLGGDSVIHDWNYLLSTLGILRYTTSVAHVLYTLGMMTICAGTISSLYFWYKDSFKQS